MTFPIRTKRNCYYRTKDRLLFSAIQSAILWKKLSFGYSLFFNCLNSNINFQTILYLAIVLYAPTIALSSITDFPFWSSIILLGLCTTAYTAVGGIRAIVFTVSCSGQNLELNSSKIAPSSTSVSVEELRRPSNRAFLLLRISAWCSLRLSFGNNAAL